MENSRKKKSKFTGNLILAIVLVLALGGFCFAGYQLFVIQKEYQEGKEEYQELADGYVTEVAESDTSEDSVTFSDELAALDTYGVLSEEVDLERLMEENPDTAGWLEYPGLGISYPIMHSEDNGYYLKRTFNGSENSSGSIFMDAVNSPDFTDYHTIIYGHNMKNGSMFGSLKKLKDEENYVSGNYFVIFTPEGSWLYQVFSCHEAAYDSDLYTVGFQPDEEYQKFLEDIKEQSIYETGVEVSKENHIVTLSTCTGNSDVRFVVHGVLVDGYDGQ